METPIQERLGDLWKNYMKIVEILINSSSPTYNHPKVGKKNSCKKAREIHKYFDRYGKFPRLLLQEIQKTEKVGIFDIYVKNLKQTREEYLRLRSQVDLPWTIVEDEMMSNVYEQIYDLFESECNRTKLLKQKVSKERFTKSTRDEIRILLDVSTKVDEVLNKITKNLKDNKLQNLIEVVKPQLLEEIYALRISDKYSKPQFDKLINKIKCVDQDSLESCQKMSNGQPRIQFLVNSIPDIVSDQVFEILKLIICKNKDFKLDPNNVYKIKCEWSSVNNKEKVKRIVFNTIKQSEKPLTFDELLTRILRELVIVKRGSSFGNRKPTLKNLKEYKSIKNALKRNPYKKRSSFGKKAEEIIFQRVIDLGILVGVLFVMGKYGHKIIKELSELWIDGEQLRRRELEDDRLRREREISKRMDLDEIQREEEHQRNLRMLEAIQRRSDDFENRLRAGTDSSVSTRGSSSPEKISYEDLTFEDVSYDELSPREPETLEAKFLQTEGKELPKQSRSSGKLFGGKSKGGKLFSKRLKQEQEELMDANIFILPSGSNYQKFIKLLMNRYEEIMRENESLTTNLNLMNTIRHQAKLDTVSERTRKQALRKEYRRLIGEVNNREKLKRCKDFTIPDT